MACLENKDFRTKGRKIREDAIKKEFDKKFPNHTTNKEEGTYKDTNNKLNYIANYTKGLPHHSTPTDPKQGEVDQDAYKKLLKAICTGRRSDFGVIPLGDSTLCARKLTNPQAAFAFDLEGPDSRALKIPIKFQNYIIDGAPKISSDEAAGEMAELYWMAICRDVNFSKYDTDNDIHDAVTDLGSNHYTNFPVPPYPTGITAKTIFRGAFPGDLDGPFISQFLLRGNDDALFSDNLVNARKVVHGYIKYGSLSIDQRQETVKDGLDFIKTYDEWISLQNGSDPRGTPDTGANTCKYDPQCGLKPLPPIASDGRGRFIRNLRDLSNYVHYDDLPQGFLNACLILKHLGIPLGHDQPCAPQPHGPVGDGNPYLNSRNQEAIATFGDQYILTLVAEVARRALYAAWFQKWFVHRRLRPEAFAGLIFRKRADPTINYPINAEILTSSVLTEIETKYGSVLLPQAYPEGSAMHPSYPSGHATIGGACVTILKAYFDEKQNIPNPVQVDESLDGTPDEGKSLKPYSGALTVGNELNKLASNIAVGRNAAGIHYRSDYVQGVLLGEEVAIRLLQDQANTYNEKYSFRFTRFNGQAIVIEKK